MVLAVDLGLAVVVFLSLLAGLRNGLFETAVSISAWIGGILAGFHLAAPILERLPDRAREIPGAEILAGVFLFLIVFAAVRLLAAALGVRRDRTQGPAGRSLGTLLGLVRGLLLAGVIASVLVAALPARSDLPQRSRVLPFLSPMGRLIAGWTPATLRERILEGWERVGGASGSPPENGYRA